MGKDIREHAYVVPGQKEVTGKVVIEGGGPLPRLLLRVSSAANTRWERSRGHPINPQSDGTFRIRWRKASVRPYSDACRIHTPILCHGSPSANESCSCGLRYGQLEIKSNPGPVSWVKVSGRVTEWMKATGARADLHRPFPTSIERTVNPDGTFSFPRCLKERIPRGLQVPFARRCQRR